MKKFKIQTEKWKYYKKMWKNHRMIFINLNSIFLIVFLKFKNFLNKKFIKNLYQNLQISEQIFINPKVFLTEFFNPERFNLSHRFLLAPLDQFIRYNKNP